jgi:membrane protein
MPDRQTVLAVVASTRAHMRRDRLTVAAGAFAYRCFLSLFPVIIALLGFTAIVDIPHHLTVTLIHGVTAALPSGAANVISSALDHAGSRSMNAIWGTVVATLVALWSATSSMVMVEEGLDMAFEMPLDRSFVQKRLVAIPLLIGATALGGAASGLTVFGSQIGNAIRGAAPVAGAAFSITWTVLRWVVALGLIALLFSLLYNVAPYRARVRWRWVSVGSVVATLIWAAVSLGFSFYTSSFDSYGRTYGAFAGVAILIFWLYLTGLAIFFGGEIDAAIARGRAAGIDDGDGRHATEPGSEDDGAIPSTGPGPPPLPA